MTRRARVRAVKRARALEALVARRALACRAAHHAPRARPPGHGARRHASLCSVLYTKTPKHQNTRPRRPLPWPPPRSLLLFGRGAAGALTRAHGGVHKRPVGLRLVQLRNEKAHRRLVEGSVVRFRPRRTGSRRGTRWGARGGRSYDKAKREAEEDPDVDVAEALGGARGAGQRARRSER